MLIRSTSRLDRLELGRDVLENNRAFYKRVVEGSIVVDAFRDIDNLAAKTDGLKDIAGQAKRCKSL